ncbi:MAG TPA: hypothetical protein VGP72_29320 [Planctomycetota bacterium]
MASKKLLADVARAEKDLRWVSNSGMQSEDAMLRLTVLLMACVLFAVLGHAGEGVPAAQFEELWTMLVKSASDMDVAKGGKVISNFPIVPSSAAISNDLACASMLVWYYDFDETMSANGGNACTEVSETAAQIGFQAKDNDRMRISALVWQKLIEKYNADRFSATKLALKERDSPPTAGEVYAFALKGYLDVKSANISERISGAITKFAETREYLVKFSLEPVNWERCAEAINRSLPFIVLEGEEARVACGFLDTGERRYLLLANPKRVGRIEPRVAHVPVIVRNIAKHPPGLEMVAFTELGNARILLAHGWQRNKERFTETIRQLLKDQSSGK